MSSDALELSAGSQTLSSDSRLHSYSQCGTSHERRLLLVRSAAHLRQTESLAAFFLWSGDVGSVTDDHFFVIVPTLYYVLEMRQGQHTELLVRPHLMRVLRTRKIQQQHEKRLQR